MFGIEKRRRPAKKPFGSHEGGLNSNDQAGGKRNETRGRIFCQGLLDPCIEMYEKNNSALAFSQRDPIPSEKALEKKVGKWWDM